MKIVFIRGAFLNLYEGQNVELIAKTNQVIGIGSKTSIHSRFSFPIKQFFSPYDIINFVQKLGRAGEFLSGALRWFCNRTLGDAHYLLGLERFVGQSGPYDIAHIAETHYGYGLQAVVLKNKGLVKKIVSTCWETIAHNNETVAGKKKIKQLVRQNVDLFICPTQGAKKALIAEGVGKEKIKVIRMGVNLDRFRVPPVLKLRGTGKFGMTEIKKGSGITLLFVGRLVAEKGILDLVNVYIKMKKEKIRDQNYKLKLKIIGSGPLRGQIESIIKKNNLMQDISMEQRRYEEMPKVYRQADMLVLPSRTSSTWEEQYGMVLVEAMACGLPIVAYNSGAIAEVVADAAILVSEGNKQKLRAALEQLIDDPLLQIRYSRLGQTRAKREFSAQKAKFHFLDCYNALLHSGGVMSPV